MMRVEMCLQVLPAALLCSIKPKALATPAELPQPSKVAVQTMCHLGTHAVLLVG